MCGWSANLESKLLAVFCSLRRLLLGTLLFEISFNWRIIGDFGIHLHNANSLDVACRNFDVACRRFRCGVRHLEVSFDRLFFIFYFLLKRFLPQVLVCIFQSVSDGCLWELGCIQKEQRGQGGQDRASQVGPSVMGVCAGHSCAVCGLPLECADFVCCVHKEEWPSPCVEQNCELMAEMCVRDGATNVGIHL